MAARKGAAQKSAADQEGAGELVRIKIRLAQERSKIFTSKGPLCDGTVVELPEAEAMAYCDRGQAMPTRDDELAVDPLVNVEKD